MSASATLHIANHEFIWVQTAFDLEKRQFFAYACTDCGERVKELASHLTEALERHACPTADSAS